MRHLVLTIAVAAASAGAMAADVGVSVRVGQPNFYGRIDLGELPRPQVVYAQPIIVQPAPVGVVVQPIYLRVPPGHDRCSSRTSGRIVCFSASAVSGPICL